MSALLLLALWLVACGGETDCDRLEDPAARADCLRPALLESAVDAPSTRAAIEAAADPVTRDLLRLKLVTADPSQSRALCPEMEGPQARRLCANIEGRSHLWKSEGAR